MKTPKKKIDLTELRKKVRKTWGKVVPVEKVIPNKKKNHKPKHKGKENE